MFAAVGNHVEALHRTAIGGLGLDDLAEGKWQLLVPAEVASVFKPAAS
jgi:16S rRNA pseudouridine516 synthase